MQYLSPEWFVAADQALRVITPVPASVAVAYHVTEDLGSVHYALVLGPDQVGISTDDAVIDHADVSFTLERSLAEAVAIGDRNASSAFLDGELRLGGDINLLLEHAKTLADVDDVLADLRPSRPAEG